MFDIDHFKNVNDTYGHQAGDEVIKAFSAIIKDTLRVTDLVARYGGEEFAATLYDVTPQVCIEIAERIRDKVERFDFVIPTSPKPIKKTVSIGVALYEDPIDAEKFIEQADKALYHAKETGRNKVSLFNSIGS